MTRFAADLGDKPIDVLINNAGVYGPKPVKAADVTVADWTPVFQTNAMAPLLVSRTLLKNVKASERKMIVNISSIMGSIEKGCRPQRIYLSLIESRVEHGHGLLRARDCRDRRRRVMFHPGWVQTDMGGAIGPDPDESITHLGRRSKS